MIIDKVVGDGHLTLLYNVGLSECNKVNKGVKIFSVFLVSAILRKTVYRKNSKIWDASNNCHNCPKNSKV